MGGAVAVRAAPLIVNLCGLGVIDVVEGTAIDALASMQSFLRSRPSSFSSISQAVEWWLVFLVLLKEKYSSLIQLFVIDIVCYSEHILQKKCIIRLILCTLKCYSFL